MIEIDGAYGEGGGSIVRMATALSALMQETINIRNIRSNRPKQGLMLQHLNAIKAVAQLSNASCDELYMGSNEIFFKPESLRGGDFEINIKTAGSIALVLQAFMIPACFAKSEVNITICGGTDVRWSPSINYLQNVTLPLLKTMGYIAEIDIIRRGHYPRGGGIVNVTIDPIKKLKPIRNTELEVNKIRGISHCVRLPEHVAVRQAESAEKVLKVNGFDAEIEIEISNNALGAGSGIILWSEGKSRIGGSAIGQRGLKAEKVGKNAAEELLYHISNGSSADKYLGDQLIPYMAIAGNSKIKTAELTLHVLTNIHVAEKIMNKKFNVIGELGDTATISVS